MLGYSPKWQYVVSDDEDAGATSRTVTIFFKNFPRPGCKDTLACKAEAIRRATKVRFGQVDVTPPESGMVETDGMLSIQVLAPPRAVAGVQALSVWAIALGEEVRVETDVSSFTYVAPPPIVSPVDGSVLGGSLVTVKAYGIVSIPAQSDVAVSIWDGNTETSVNVLAVTENVQAGLFSEMTLSLSMPAFTSAGVFTCRIKRRSVVGGSAELLTDFLFEYFST